MKAVTTAHQSGKYMTVICLSEQWIAWLTTMHYTSVHLYT
jgi:hypothetical protein